MSQTTAEKVKKVSIYPGIKEVPFESYSNALCEFKVDLPAKVKSRISEFSKLMYPKLTAEHEMNPSVLNCFDFHYSDSKLKLIEINTNASGFMISNLLEKEEVTLEYEEVILSSFIQSFGEKPKKIYINDEAPELEKMIIEFHMYKDFFHRNGIEAEIIKTKDLLALVSSSEERVFCYNRDCDFYLEENLELKKFWREGKLVLSAHPEAYEGLASKKVLLNLSNASDVFLQSHEVTDENQSEIWEKRKSFFFKPLESYGSKGVYSGKSISKKKFQEIIEIGGYMAQEIHLPSKIEYKDETWKYDIRAFFSSNEIQKVIARVYKGQVTNFKEPGGGFALIDWID